MQIQFQNNLPQSPNKINKNKKLTKCAKMTEEGETIRNGINGAANIHSFNYSRSQIDVPHKASELEGTVLASASNKQSNNGSTLGGRLQFFKDGKFILELARSGEGEKSGWVSVPRKTYWPPTAPPNNNVNHHKNESSASLSFSDDNSSVQSSPWQRDHCWKQATPRRNISREMAMYYCRPTGCTLSQIYYKTARIKRRRPYDTFFEKSILEKKNACITQSGTEKTVYIKGIKIKDEVGEDSEQSSMHADDKLVLRSKLETVFKRKHGNKKLLNRQKLNVVLQKLIDRIPEGMVLLSVTGTPGVVNHLTSNASRVDLLHQHVSPRKRILRELEKVSLEDLSTMKRSRAKGTSNNCHLVTSPLTSTSTTISHSNTIGTASQHINFPYISSNNVNKLINGSHSESGTLPLPTTQTSRPISSYSITSLLGHNNNNNNSIKIESNAMTNHKDILMADPTHLRTMLTSPKSPAHFQQITPKPSPAFSSKKKSPSYTGSRSSVSPSISATTPSLQNHYNSSPSLHSPINYGRNRSPDLSPSPEQIYTRYRQPHGIPYHSTALSSPSSSGFHPYLSSASSRGSPSGALSPPSSETHRYRTNLIAGSPSHQCYSSSVSQNNSSPLSYSRYSPSGYSQISPQHYSSKSTVNSTTYNLNSLIHSNTNKSRDMSPNSILSRAEPLRDNSSYIGTRTVPKKTAALRQQYESPVSSPSSSDHRNSETYYKSITPVLNEQSSRKLIDGTGSASLNLSSPRSPETAKHFEKDFRMINSTNTSSVLSGLDLDSNAHMIRPSLVPSLSQNMYYMYAPHSSAVGVPPPSGSYLPPVYYHSMAYAGAYRNPLWMHYPAVQPSRLSTSMLSYAGGLGPPPTNSTTPWGTVPHHTLLTDESVALIRIKDEPSSDVPLNLSKH